MNVEGEQGREASDGESAEEEEEEGEDSSVEDAEHSGGSDGHSDLDSDVESEEEISRPSAEHWRTPRTRSTTSRQEAREAARTELPYTFAGDKTVRFPWVSGQRPAWSHVCLAGAAHAEWGLRRPPERVDTSRLLRLGWRRPLLRVSQLLPWGLTQVLPQC